ncbi:hypothetical protein FJ417_27820 [Mesorhizobium sp. B3-1-7]|uniref:histidine kinase n=1 Tax=Mesorhizobium sp. B3-1-7 TaxID=2589894 RepID=UPI001126B581|nr:histidine kinase dimerization/phosphoacceptor domain-containing protein [Mesorhizobium sp. B3-1-7]TPI51927.1 hypothetical protein FJ417_27820 [Mesorhizobium sp. B3-1-7]
MPGNGNGKPIGLTARAWRTFCAAASGFNHARVWLGHSPWATRHFVLLVVVISLSMVALGWWIDQCIAVAAGATTGLAAVPGRTQAVAAVALAWAVMLGAIVLVFRRDDFADGDRSALAHILHYERIGQRIHDGPAQMLTYVILRLDELEDMLRDAEGSTQHVSRQIIQDVKSASVDALNDLRQISRQLA